MNLALGFSRGLAIVFGVALPIGETIRRWNNIVYWPAFVDDWLIGAFLLWGAWATRRRADAADGVGRRRGWRILCGAWGFTCGMGYASFVGHLRDIGQPDVGPFPHVWVTSVIGVGWVLAIVALFATMYGRRDDDS
jgi:hypothetical protein